MKKNIRYITIVAACMAVAAMIIGCKQTVTVSEKKDTTPPKEVTNLKAVTGDGKISLSWVNPADADLYQVEITASPAAGTLTNPVYLSAEKGKAMSFTAEGLANGTAYTFTVKTIDKALNKSTGVSTAEAVKPVDTSDKTPPAEVTALNAVAGDGKISLSWVNPADADLYQVEITASPAAGTLTNPVYLSAEKGKAMSFTAEGLANGTAYTFTVRTIDKSLNKSTGASTAEAVKPVDTSDKTPPAEVTELKAVAGNGKVSLSWKNPADDDLYQVEMSAKPAAGSLTNPVYLSAVKGAAGGFMAEGLTNNTEYTFTLKTIDKSLNVGKAVTVKAAPKGSGGGSSADTTAPAEVTALNAVAGDGKVSLSWTNPADEDLYQVEITASPAAGTLSNAVYLSAKKDENMSFTVEGLTNGTGYTFTVRTIDKALNKSEGTSTPETVKPVSMGDTTPPAEVTNLQAAAGSASVILLSWMNPADEDLHQVEITASPAAGALANAVYLLAKKGEAGSYTVTGLAADTEYTVTVKTIDKALNKSAGVSKTARTQTAPAAGEPMTLTLTQNPTAPTNGNVTISLTSSTSVKTAKWAKGVKTVDEVLSSGTPITGNSFEVSENAKYSVGVQDNEGRREVKIIEIGNIDKEPPSKVKSLSAVYDSGNQKIIVTWTNPTDSDFAGLTLSWKKGGGDATDVPLTKDKTGYELPVTPVVGDVYTVSVRAKDDAGNESEPASVSVTASLGPSLNSIELSRAHLAYNDTDLTITATLKGSNFDLIASQSDPTVKAGIFKDSTLVGSLQNAAAAGSDYTVTLTAPPLSSSEATVEGAVYTVKVKLCGTYQSVTETFVISKEARLTAQPELSVTQIASSEVTPSTTTKITIKGINLDIAGGITVQLYDSNGAAYGSAAPIDTSNTGRELTTLTANIPVPSDEGVFTAKVLFGGVIQTSYYEGSSYDDKKNVTHPAIQVYGSPKFTSFTIPNAGISKEDSTVMAAVKGANFKAPGVTESNFSVSCATTSITNSSAITIIDDATLKVSLTIPGTADNYTVTVTCGSASIVGTFSVKDYAAYTPGKIVLANKTLVDKDSYTEIDSSNPPVAIICGINGYGAALGIALHISPESLRWAKDGSTGYYTKFEDIICTPSNTGSGAASTATFTGDLDGSDNWDYICGIDPEGTANAAENYPAFNWVNQYNAAYADKLGGTNFAWYMPSLAELCEVYRNREAINASLAKIHGLDSDYADSNLGTSWYWSSSQFASGNNLTWRVKFSQWQCERQPQVLL